MKIKKTTFFTIIIYGIFVIAFGLLGYINTQSLVSLIMGSSFGTLLIISAFIGCAHKKAGLISAVFLTFILTATFSYRYALVHKPIPAFLSVFSAGMLIFLLVQTANWKGRD